MAYLFITRHIFSSSLGKHILFLSLCIWEKWIHYSVLEGALWWHPSNIKKWSPAFRVLNFREEEERERKGRKEIISLINTVNAFSVKVWVSEQRRIMALISLPQYYCILFGFIAEFLCFTILSNSRRISLMIIRADIHCVVFHPLYHITHPRCFMCVILCLIHLCPPSPVCSIVPGI